MGCQAGNVNPGQDEESIVIGDQVQVLLSHLGAPSYEPVSASDVAWSRRPAKTRNGTVVEQNQVLQMLTHRLGIPKVVEVLDEAVEELLMSTAANLEDLDAFINQAKIPGNGRLIDKGKSRLPALRQRIRGRLALGRKVDMAGSIQFEHKRATDLIAQGAVWLNPVPCQAEPLRESASALEGVFLDQPADEAEVLGRNGFASVG